MNEHHRNLLALVAFVVILGGWMLTAYGIIPDSSPLDWVLAITGAVLSLVTLVVTIIISRRSS